MNQDIKQRWVEALRSGLYEQGKSRLRKRDAATLNESYCCLGVLCELAVQDDVIPEPKFLEDDGDFLYGNVTNLGGSTQLPPEVIAWAGLSEHSADPAIEYPRSPGEDSTLTEESVWLSEYNDDTGTFLQIADLIDRFL